MPVRSHDHSVPVAVVPGENCQVKRRPDGLRIPTKVAGRAMDSVEATVVEPKRKRRTRSEKDVRRQPRYHVLLWDDDDHSYDYVIRMLKELFGFPLEQGFQLAEEVDHRGKAVLLTTTREHAELKRDQIHAYGHDPRGSMSASIEPER